MFVPLMTLLAVVSAAVLFRAERQGDRPAVVIAKPLTTLTLVLLAAFSAPAVPSPYALLVVIGLSLSLVGDVFLLWPRERFLHGLLAFLAAHVAYTAAFVSRAQPESVAPFLPFLLAAAFVGRLLWRHAGRLRGAVAAYSVVIAVMAGSALAAAVASGSPGAWVASAGTCLFLLSDAALAMDRFVGPIPSGHYVVLGTYYPAQWLIALSVGLS